MPPSLSTRSQGGDCARVLHQHGGMQADGKRTLRNAAVTEAQGSVSVSSRDVSTCLWL
jgi:hypothetical protein